MAISQETLNRLAAAFEESSELTDEQMRRFVRYQRRVEHIAAQIAYTGEDPAIETVGLGGRGGGFTGGGKQYGQLLLEGGVDTLDDFLAMTWREVLDLPGIGRVTARRLWKTLKRLGYNPDWTPPVNNK